MLGRRRAAVVPSKASGMEAYTVSSPISKTRRLTCAPSSRVRAGIPASGGITDSRLLPAGCTRQRIAPMEKQPRHLHPYNVSTVVTVQLRSYGGWRSKRPRHGVPVRCNGSMREIEYRGVRYMGRAARLLPAPGAVSVCARESRPEGDWGRAPRLAQMSDGLEHGGPTT
jgi:hypothetical protein